MGADYSIPQKLAAAFRLFAKYGYDHGFAGHITARDPDHPDQFWVNPAGLAFAMVRSSDLLKVDHGGKILAGEGPYNQAAFAIHSRIHAARPEVMAAAHAHTPAGRAFASLGHLLAPLNQDACAFYNDHVLFPEYTGVIHDPREADKLAMALGDNKAVILQNHGLLTVGQSVDSAAWWFIALERCCEAQLQAEAAGIPKPIPPDIARKAHNQVGSEAAGKNYFSPLLKWICSEQPDLLE